VIVRRAEIEGWFTFHEPPRNIIPGFMATDHEQIAFDILGGWNQAQAQFVSDMSTSG
jgi:hypothetical protein